MSSILIRSKSKRSLRLVRRLERTCSRSSYAITWLCERFVHFMFITSFRYSIRWIDDLFSIFLFFFPQNPFHQWLCPRPIWCIRNSWRENGKLNESAERNKCQSLLVIDIRISFLAVDWFEFRYRKFIGKRIEMHVSSSIWTNAMRSMSTWNEIINFWANFYRCDWWLSMSCYDCRLHANASHAICHYFPVYFDVALDGCLDYTVHNVNNILWISIELVVVFGCFHWCLLRNSFIS